AYGLGSIPFGFLLVKYVLARGVDIRTVGSGNVGATNVSRVAGLSGGLLTLLLDAGKGAAGVILAGHLTDQESEWMGVAAMMTIVGHVFPIWLKGRGGKGVATGFGAFLVISPLAMACALAVWVVMVGWKRYVSLGSITAAASAPLLIWIVESNFFHRETADILPGLVAVTLGSALIIARHRENIRRLLQGSEHKFGSRVSVRS
ncbi:MAG TPA: glycerol-3-phosphate 1-O-acyltransferase PlsY, partial [Blastocatellia bacterium]|nr:glycerol-3-phosphate 1-O-acyltransferase PlsY [Blastocatellia bacterium]